MSNEPSFLVIDGYSREGRAELEAGGATTAGELYRQMLQKCAPGCAVEVIHPADPDVALPEATALRSYDALAWTGSSLTVYADEPQVTAQIALARAAFAERVPSFGSCWALQVAVVAAGGRVAANPRGREMGIARKIALTAEGRAHPLYRGKPSVFDAFISHEDEVTELPGGAVLLASNAFTHVQAAAIEHLGGVCWAIQYHPEYDLHEMARLTYCRAAKLIKKGFFVDHAAVLDYVDKLETLHRDPGRGDLAWLLGIDTDLTDETIRVAEVRNWIHHLVLPSLRK